ncbi:MAG: sulfatase-like hydrolase/transferase, partial [Pseudobdellovibrionaceae bacterium]
MKQSTKKIFLSIAVLGLSFALGSCHWAPSTSSSSMIIIAVDQLGVNEVNCDPQSPTQARSGIALICQESVRFTHAYTTSPLSGPALTSVLTGQYPFQHGLRSNSKSFLPGRVNTLTEVVQKRGYATSFFSGGAPILRKLNLQQGFETFDDAFTPTPQKLFKPFAESQEAFKTWLREIRSQNFFSVFYVPDLAFTQTVTVSDLGQTRNLSFESQFEEFDESLYSFIQDLKSRNLWDSTLLVLVGLNGPDRGERSVELPNTNLFSERVQVGLLIKPSQKPRDQGLNWSYDGNLTLADLGVTFFEPFEPIHLKDLDFPVHSLQTVLKSPFSEKKNPPERFILTESAWMEDQPIRYSLRWGQYLFILDEKPQIFNSLIDRFETSSLKTHETSVRDLWSKIESIRQKKQWLLWPEPLYEKVLKWQGLAAGKLTSWERLAHRLKDDMEINNLYSRELLALQNWENLERWAQGMKFKDLEKIAHKNLKKENRQKFEDPCLATLDLPHPKSSDL